MGVMFAIGAIARVLGPFWAVEGYNRFGPISVFGVASAFFAVSLVAMRRLWGAFGLDGDFVFDTGSDTVSEGACFERDPFGHTPRQSSRRPLHAPLPGLAEAGGALVVPQDRANPRVDTHRQPQPRHAQLGLHSSGRPPGLRAGDTAAYATHRRSNPGAVLAVPW